ncbi:MAG: AarF/ABC1/UbiB kinase family protein, partial [Deltaproteobacteria bacterium]
RHGVPRAARIAATLAPIAAAYRVHAGRAPYVSDEVARARLDALHRRSAERVHDLCVELGGAILKLAQFASCRVDLLPPAWTDTLGRLQDRVPPAPTDEVLALLAAELGAPPEEVFAELDLEPLAAASLAQVHAARLPDGTRVVVKVQRPGVAELVEVDLAALQLVSGRLGDGLGVDAGAFLAELGRSVRAELDYTAEARHMAAVREHLADHPGVVVPAPHLALCTPRVLVMERVDGDRLPDFLAACADGGETGAAERDALLRHLVDVYAAKILVHGVVQADPHPGNFLVTGDRRLALLDFGAVLTLSAETRRAWAELAGAALARDTAKIGALLGRLGFAPHSGDPADLGRLAELVLDAFRDGAADLGDIDMRAELDRGLALLRDTPVARVPEDFVLLSRILGALAGLLVGHDAGFPLFPVVWPHLQRALAT